MRSVSEHLLTFLTTAEELFDDPPQEVPRGIVVNSSEGAAKQPKPHDDDNDDFVWPSSNIFERRRSEASTTSSWSASSPPSLDSPPPTPSAANNGHVPLAECLASFFDFFKEGGDNVEQPPAIGGMAVAPPPPEAATCPHFLFDEQRPICGDNVSTTPNSPLLGSEGFFTPTSTEGFFTPTGELMLTPRDSNASHPPSPSRCSSPMPGREMIGALQQLRGVESSEDDVGKDDDCPPIPLESDGLSLPLFTRAAFRRVLSDQNDCEEVVAADGVTPQQQLQLDCKHFLVLEEPSTESQGEGDDVSKRMSPTAAITTLPFRQ